jgi:hypothetical protein
MPSGTCSLADITIHSLGPIVLIVLQFRVVRLPSQDPDLCKSHHSEIADHAFSLFKVSSMQCYPENSHGHDVFSNVEVGGDTDGPLHQTNK